MIITKVFDIIFNIDNINDLFNKDINQTILNLVKQKYNGKCFLGVYIMDVIKIINRSLIESNQSKTLHPVAEICIILSVCITIWTRSAFRASAPVLYLNLTVIRSPERVFNPANDAPNDSSVSIPIMRRLSRYS